MSDTKHRDVETEISARATTASQCYVASGTAVAMSSQRCESSGPAAAAASKEWIELPLPDSWSATEEGSEAFVYFQIDPSLTNYVNRVIEGYEYLGVMSTVDGKTGIMVLRTTESQRPLALDMLATLPQVKAFVKPR